MAKKKRGTPSKACVDPNCGTTMHARQLVCPKCGKAQPSKTKSKIKAKAKAKVKAKAAPAEPPAQGGLKQAVSFVRQVGGLFKAKKLLGEIEEIKNL